MFTDQYADEMDNKRSMHFRNGFDYMRTTSLNSIHQLWTKPILAKAALVAFWDRRRVVVENRPLLGWDAIRNVTGFRYDGSMLMPHATYKQNAVKVQKNEGVLDAAPGGPSISDRQWSNLEWLSEICRDNDVKIIAVQFPMLKATVDFLNKDESYRYYSGVWRDFESPATRKKLQDMEITFIDMTGDPIFDDPTLFMDAAHLTEVGTSLAVEHLARDPRLASFLPNLQPDLIKRDREAALMAGDPYEVYGDKF